MTAVSPSLWPEILPAMFRGGTRQWLAVILVQTPYSVALACRRNPFAAILFDNHKPVIAVSGPMATADVLGVYLSDFF